MVITKSTLRNIGGAINWVCNDIKEKKGGVEADKLDSLSKLINSCSSLVERCKQHEIDPTLDGDPTYYNKLAAKGTDRRTIMNERTRLRNHSGFALISIVVVLFIICFLAVRELPKYFSLDEDKDKIKKDTINMTDGAVPKTGAITDDSKNMAGVAALAAATSNVQMVYAKLLVNNTSGMTITNADVVNLLNSSHTVVGDYVVSYSTSGTDKITATLQSSSKGKFGTPNSKVSV